MRCAIAEAVKALEKGEVPVGAVIVHRGRVIARGHNSRETLRDPTAHAEMIAIREASRILGRWRLTDAELYVTLEPCPMCAGAIISARLRTVVFGALDPKAGAAGSVLDLLADSRFNSRPHVYDAVMWRECRALLHSFFAKRRNSER